MLKEARARYEGGRLVMADGSEPPPEGAEVVVVYQPPEHEPAGGDKKPKKGKGTLLEFFQNSPLRGVELDLERDKDTGRDIVL